MRGGVFVCHASQDAAVAQQVVAVLERADVPCWIAPRDIEPGEEYTQAILDALEAAPAIVLVFSAATNESPHVRRELETAVGSDTSIVPVRVEAVEPSGSLRYFIGSAQWLEAVGTRPGQWEEGLVRGVRRALEKGGARTSGAAAADGGRTALSPPTGPGSTGSFQRWLVPLLAAVAVLLVVVVVGLVVTDDDPATNADGPDAPTSSSPPTGDSPSTPATSSAPTDDPAILVEDAFDEASTALGTGSGEVDGGRIFRDVVDGAYVVRVTGIPDGNKAWTNTSTAGLSDSWSVSTDVVSQELRGCGVMVGEGDYALTAVLDRANGVGEVMWFRGKQPLGDETFETIPGDQGRISLSREGEDLVLRVAGAELARVRPPGIERPLVAGLAAMGSDNTCVFDNFLVTR